MHGAGTRAFPWQITFGNMGPVTLSAAAANLDAGPGSLAARSASGIDGTVIGITDVTGTSQEDLFYGIQRELVLVHEFSGIGSAGAPDIAGQDALVFTGTLNLRTGQPVLYEVNAGHDTVNGLLSGKVYFVGAETAGGTTTVKFYLTQDDALRGRNAIKLSDPHDAGSDNARHTLKDVPVVHGGNGESTIVSTPSLTYWSPTFTAFFRIRSSARR